MNELDPRNIWISLAIVLPIAAVALFLLRHDPTAKGFVALATVVGGAMLLNVLDEREQRRKGTDRRRLHER